MPELPEVETIKKGLTKYLVGHTIVGVDVKTPKVFTGDTKNIFGAQVKGIRRFAKVLVVGGGALLLKEALTTQFGHKVWVPNDAVLSIARGLWKLSVMKR